jgi:hypothetical protein
LSIKPSSAEFKYSLVTRPDFDGVVCTVLLKEVDLIDDIKFMYPKRHAEQFIQDVTAGGIMQDNR